MKDVTKMNVIGEVITFDDRTYDIVDVINENENLFYVCNFWYKKHKSIPQLIPSQFVKTYYNN
jgi:hypothetical protein